MSKIVKFQSNPKKHADPEQAYELIMEQNGRLLECLYKLQEQLLTLENAAREQCSSKHKQQPSFAEKNESKL